MCIRVVHAPGDVNIQCTGAMFPPFSCACCQNHSQTGWELNGVLYLTHSIHMGPQRACSRRWHPQIWRWRQYICNTCYHVLQSDTSVPTCYNVIMPSTPTPPTFILQLFLDFLFLHQHVWFISPYFFQMIFFIQGRMAKFIPSQSELNAHGYNDIDLTHTCRVMQVGRV